MESREYKTITGRMYADAYAYESCTIPGKLSVKIKVKTDSGVFTIYDFLDINANLEDTIYSKLTYYTPVTISYYMNTCDVLMPYRYDEETGKDVYFYEDFHYNHISSVEITGNGLEDLIRNRQISEKLISEIKDMILPVNGSLTKSENKLIVKLPIADKIYTMELHEPDGDGYRDFYVGYDYMQPWGSTEDNTDYIVKDEIQEVVDYILNNK